MEKSIRNVSNRQSTVLGWFNIVDLVKFVDYTTRITIGSITIVCIVKNVRGANTVYQDCPVLIF